MPPSGEKAPKRAKSEKAPSAQFVKELIEHRPQLLKQARGLLRSDDAEDLVQTVYEKALANHAQFTPGTNLGAWLFQMMRNHVRNEARHEQVVRRANYERAARDRDELRSSIHEHDPDVSRQIKELEKAVEILPADLREAFMLNVGYGHTYEEALALINKGKRDEDTIELGTVRSRVSRARALLKKALEAQENKEGQ